MWNMFEPISRKKRASQYRTDARANAVAGYPGFADLLWELAEWIDPTPREPIEEPKRRTRQDVDGREYAIPVSYTSRQRPSTQPHTNQSTRPVKQVSGIHNGANQHTRSGSNLRHVTARVELKPVHRSEGEQQRVAHPNRTDQRVRHNAGVPGLVRTDGHRQALR